MKSHSSTLKMKTTGVDSAERSLNALIMLSFPCCCSSLQYQRGSLLISDRIIPSYNGPSASQTITHWCFENLHGEVTAFYERVGSFPLRNCNYFMACTQNQCVSCGFATDSHNCRALIIHRQVKPALVARNRKSLNKKHPVSKIFLNEDGVSSSRFLFFLLIYISLFLFLCLNVLVK